MLFFVLFICHAIAKNPFVYWILPIFFVMTITLAIIYAQFREYQVTEELPDTSHVRLVFRILLGINAVLMWILVIFIILLIAGAAFNENSEVQYPIRGRQLTVGYDGAAACLFSTMRLYGLGIWQEINVLCEGPENSTVVWLRIGGGHFYCELYPLQIALRDLGFRTCMYDRAGTFTHQQSLSHCISYVFRYGMVRLCAQGSKRRRHCLDKRSAYRR